MDQQGIPGSIIAFIGMALAVAVTIVTIIISIVLSSHATEIVA